MANKWQAPSMYVSQHINIIDMQYWLNKNQDNLKSKSACNPKYKDQIDKLIRNIHISIEHISRELSIACILIIILEKKFRCSVHIQSVPFIFNCKT